MGPQGETIYPEGPQELAARARRVRARLRRQRRRRMLRNDARAHHRAARRRRVASSASARPRRRARAQEAASAMTAVSLEQQPRPLLVGERINAQGSRKIKRLLLEDRYDDIVLVAREQVEGGAHLLDVCCALTERAGRRRADARARAAARAIDRSAAGRSTRPSPKCSRSRCKTIPGRAILNSVHLEVGPREDRCRACRSRASTAPRSSR